MKPYSRANGRVRYCHQRQNSHFDDPGPGDPVVLDKGGIMQISFAAVRSSFLVASLLAAPAAAQLSNNRPAAEPRANPVAIEKVNKRPLSRIESSINEYQKLLATTPGDAVILNNLGAMYFLAGRYYESQSTIRKAAQRAPRSLPIRVNLAIALNKTYNPTLAITTLQGVLKEDPKQDRAQQVLCEIYLHEDLKSDALACYQVLRSSGKMEALAAANYSTLLLDSGDVDGAFDVLRWADENLPADAGVKNGLGVVLFRKKKYADAEKNLQQAVVLEPAAAQARFNLAMAQMANNKRSAVLDQYNFLKRSNPELAGKLYKIIFRDKMVSAAPRK